MSEKHKDNELLTGLFTGIIPPVRKAQSADQLRVVPRIKLQLFLREKEDLRRDQVS